jgi:riboflavin kinase/FMN adenylyltransferase
MKVYQGIEQFNQVQGAVVTLGTFDGVHLGHQKILKRLKELAAQNGGETVVLTFNPHPRMVLYPDDHKLKLLSTIEERMVRFKEAGIDHLIIVPFTKEFSRMSASEFVENIILDKIGASILVIGHDHRFGKNREGDYKVLEQLASERNFLLEETAAEDWEEITISSTKIRAALEAGDIAKANALLGHHYSFVAEVIHGDAIGRTIGFPTANLKPTEYFKLIPGDGVYAVYVNVDGSVYGGMMNMGFRPTVGGIAHTREVHIFDFDGNIYGQELTITVVNRIRNEEKFANIEALKIQLGLDKAKALSLLSE